MRSKKLAKVSKKDLVWQQKIEKQIEKEKVELSHPKGKERFEKAVLKSLIKKSK